MSDDFDQRLATGGTQVAIGMATANPLKVLEGVGTILGLETNNSATQKLVVADFETFVGEQLHAGKEESAQHKRRLDTFEQRLATMTWLVEDFESRLGERGARPSDLLALLAASFEVWKSTADAKKRELLGNALRNAFDPKQYEEGLTLRLLGLLAQLDYGDVWVLRELRNQQAWPRTENGALKVSSQQLGPGNGKRVPINAKHVGKKTMIANHIARLEEHRLIHQRGHSWELDGKPNTTSGLEINELTELGERLLKLVADGESSPEAEPRAAPSSQ